MSRFARGTRTGDSTFGNLPHAIDATGVHQQLTPLFVLLDTRDALTAITSIMTEFMFGGESRTVQR